MKKAIYLAQLIANAYPERMRLLYQANGISAPVSAKSFIDAYLVLGEPFLMDVFNLVWEGMQQSKFSNVVGLETDKLEAYQQANLDTVSTLSDSASKTGFWDGLKNTFNNAGSILGTADGTYDSISKLFGGNTVNTGTSTSAEAQAALQAQMYQLQLQQQEAEQASQTKTWILIGVGLVVVALVAIMLIKKK